MAISQNDTLYNLIGTTYGGDGVNTFALPDLRSRVPLGTGAGPGLQTYSLAQNGGTETQTLTATQMPAHHHKVQASGANADSYRSSSHYPARPPAKIYSQSTNATMFPGTINTTGGSQPHENMQPYLAVSFIISLFGIYPSQG